MAFNPYQAIGTGVSDTSQVNGPITGLNTVLSGFGQSAFAACNSPLTVNLQTPMDVSGCSLTVTPVGSNAFAVVSGVFDCSATVTTSNQVVVGLLAVDGATQTPEGHADDRISRVTFGQTWVVPLAAGSHTLKLQSKRAQAGGAFTMNTTHTTMTVVLYDIP